MDEKKTSNLSVLRSALRYIQVKVMRSQLLFNPLGRFLLSRFHPNPTFLSVEKSSVAFEGFPLALSRAEKLFNSSLS